MTVKLASYNIQFGYGQDHAYNLGRIIETVRGQDIICLQEVTTNWQACNGDDQPEKIASALEMYSVFAPGFEVDVGGKDADGKPLNKRRGRSTIG